MSTFAATTILVLLAVIIPEVCSVARGAIGLDSFTFDKVVDGSRTMLVKIDKQYPYGDKEDAYKEFLKDIKETHLLVAEVGVQDYGDKENDDIRERFGIKTPDFPAFLLFNSKDTSKPVRFDGDVTTENLKRFVTTESGMWIGLKGTLQAFDMIVGKFLNRDLTIDQSQQSIEEAAQNIDIGSTSDSTESSDNINKEKRAKMYQVIFKKIKEKIAKAPKIDPLVTAKDFVKTEIARVAKLIKGKVSDSKKAMLEFRINILSTFLGTPTKNSVDEQHDEVTLNSNMENENYQNNLLKTSTVTPKKDSSDL